MGRDSAGSDKALTRRHVPTWSLFFIPASGTEGVHDRGQNTAPKSDYEAHEQDHDLAGGSWLLEYGHVWPFPSNVGSRIAGVDDKWYAELAKPSTDYGAISVAKAQINYRCREIGMLSRAQAGLDIASSDYSCSRDSQCVFDVESDERLVLDDKDQTSGERDRQHNKSPGEGAFASLNALEL